MCVSVNSRGGVRHACVCLGYLCVSSSVHRAAVCAGAESCHWLRVCARVSVSDKASVSSLSVCLAAGRTPAASGWIMKSRFFLRLLQDTCHQYLTQRKPDCRGWDQLLAYFIKTCPKTGSSGINEPVLVINVLLWGASTVWIKHAHAGRFKAHSTYS